MHNNSLEQLAFELLLEVFTMWPLPFTPGRRARPGSMSDQSNTEATARGNAPGSNIIDGGFERPSERAMRLAEPIWIAIYERAAELVKFTRLEAFVHRNRDMYSSTIASQLNRTERSIDQIRTRAAKKWQAAMFIAAEQIDAEAAR